MIQKMPLCFAIIGFVLGLLAVFGLYSPAVAQQYPSKPVRIIVPYAPGGDYDAIARLIAGKLSESLAGQFVVENRPGASGTLGTELGVKAAPDGYTFTLIGAGYPVNASVYPLKYDPVNSITAILQLTKGPYLAAVHPSIPAKTIKELIAFARSKPGQLNYANSGSTVYMATELFLNMAGLKMTSIPYKGTGPAIIDTIAGNTSMFFGSIGAILPHVKSGRLRGLAVTTAERVAAEPDIPSIAEAGLAGYDVSNWHGLIGPKGLSRAIVDRIHSESVRAMTSDDVRKVIQGSGISPVAGTPDALLRQISKEIELWRKVVRQSGIKMEL